MTSGVYSIRNTENDNLYIGSSRDIESRWARHKRLLQSGNHHSRHLQNAWNCYGNDCFEFEIIETCDVDTLIEVEQKYIDDHSPVYNVSPTAGRTAGVVRTKAYRAKQSISQSGKVIPDETRKKISEGMKGKQNSLGTTRDVSQETKEKISQTLMGHSVSKKTRQKIGQKNNGYRHTEEAKRKIGAASVGNKYASRKHTEEEKKRRSESLREHYRRKKEDAERQSGN